jgi:hypothetical protein
MGVSFVPTEEYWIRKRVSMRIGEEPLIGWER